MSDTSTADLIRIIEKNAVDGCVAWKVWPALTLIDEPGLLWTLTDIPFPVFNAVLSARFSPDSAKRRIESVLSRAREKDVPVAWFVGPESRPSDLGEHLIASGFLPEGSSTGMAAELECLDLNSAGPEGLSIEEVLDLETFQSWCDVMIPVYEFPDFVSDHWLELHASMGFGRNKSWRHFLARMKGEPVAVSSLFLGENAASVANVATVPAARGRGIGTAVTTRALRTACESGYRLATLCASEMGESLYRRIGMKIYCCFRLYLWGGE